MYPPAGAKSRALLVTVALVVTAASGCSRPRPVEAAGTPPEIPANPPPSALVLRAGEIRATGTIQAVRAFTVQVPQIVTAPGNNGRITLVKLTPNGTVVKQGDVLAEFDRTQQVEAAREAVAKYEDLAQQVKQKEAQNRSDAEKRSADQTQAEADLAKAKIQLKKGSVLSDIDRQKNEVKAESAQARVDSLAKIDHSRSQNEKAALEVLKLQMQRQKVALERAQLNAEKLVLRAPIAGMVALENIWRGGSMGHAQEGDQLFPGQGLLKIFDPGEMEVRTLVGEPDGAVLKPGTVAAVYIDAYPDAVFRASYVSASPVATTALGSPIKNFVARFRLEARDPRLLPDLSAAVIVRGEGTNEKK